MLLETTVAHQPITALFSGDTIVARECWNEQALTQIWGRLALALMDRYPPGTLYWFLISKGYKTYLLLTNNFPTAFPSSILRSEQHSKLTQIHQPMNYFDEKYQKLARRRRRRHVLLLRFSRRTYPDWK